MKFFDTSALLNATYELLEEDAFSISVVTLSEIEHIKTSSTKSEEVKYNARRIARWLLGNVGCFKVYADYPEAEKILADKKLAITNDNIILSHAFLSGCQEFVTDDLCQSIIGRELFGLNVVHLKRVKDEYCGYKEVEVSDDLLASLYQEMDHNFFECLTNEYVLLRDKHGALIDTLKWDGEKYCQLKRTSTLKSTQFGDVRPYKGDIYQKLAIDSLSSNQITMLRGSAGTGKSYLALAYLFQQLEKEKIDKIIVFCNPLATAGAARLGYYPGSRTDKILDSGPGMMLSAKLGDREIVERLISDKKLVLLPMSDIRGYDTTGMKAGIYISEAQNMDVSLAKLVLQRIGEDSICVIDGDFNTQVDSSLFVGSSNGMRRISEVFRGHPIYGEVELKNIYRSEIARIAEEM